jgi:hypothetical protein
MVSLDAIIAYLDSVIEKRPEGAREAQLGLVYLHEIAKQAAEKRMIRK